MQGLELCVIDGLDISFFFSQRFDRDQIHYLFSRHSQSEQVFPGPGGHFIYAGFRPLALQPEGFGDLLQFVHLEPEAGGAHGGENGISFHLSSITIKMLPPLSRGFLNRS
jgi:hypothetical protein